MVTPLLAQAMVGLKERLVVGVKCPQAYYLFCSCLYLPLLILSSFFISIKILLADEFTFSSGISGDRLFCLNDNVIVPFDEKLDFSEQISLYVELHNMSVKRR